jgi:chemotaxis protein MotB
MKKPLGILLFTLAAGSSACVSQVKYDRAVVGATAAQDSLQESIRLAIIRTQTDQQEIASLRGELDRSKQESDALQQETSKLKVEAHNASASLDEQTAINQQLRAELTRLGKNVDQLLSDKGTLSRSLDEARQRLEELRRAQAAAEARAALFRDLALKFKQMTDAGELSVTLRDGRVILQLPNDVLFDSGRSELKPQGKEALQKVAEVLRVLHDRQFQVAGHTDNVPIHSARFPSNWELSAARAIVVVELLVDAGVSPQMLSAAGYGEFNPILPNDSAIQKAKNRRTEIMLVPKIEEIPAIPSLKS